MTEKRSKYNVSKDKEKLTYNGVVWASALELRYYKEVVEVGLATGEFQSCRTQVKYELLPSFVHNGKKYNGINYVSDFNLIDKDGHEIVVDTKGMLKPIDIIKEKLLLSKYPDMDFRLIGFSKIDGGFVSLDTIKKGRKERKKAKNDNNKKVED